MSLLELVIQKRPEILAIAAKHGARDLRLFGSVVRGEEHRKSDIDFLVDVEWREQGGLWSDLERLLGVRVDVVSDPAFKERVLANSIPLEAPDFSERAVIESQRSHMPNDRDERHVRQMLQYSKEVIEFSRRMTREAFLTDELQQRGLVLSLALIAEEATKVTDEYESRHPEIPWRKVVDFRNRAIHAYGTLDLERVWDQIVAVDVPALKAALEALL